MNWLKQMRLLSTMRAGTGRGSRHRRAPRSRPQLEQLERRSLLSLVLQGTFTTGSSPFAVAVADVNTDGKLDLAVVNPGSTTVSVLLGNGNGTFAAKQDFTTGTNPRSVAVADVNGDGKPDVAVANFNSNTVNVLLGNGNGTFAAKQDFTAGSGADFLVAADFNGDGKVDLAVVNYYSNTVSILLGKKKT